MERAFDGIIADPDHLLDLHRTGQCARQFIERGRALLAVQRHARLEPQTRGELPRDQTHRQHDEKREQVLHVAHRERKAGRHEEEIEGTDAQHRGQRGRAAAEAHADHHDRQEVDGDDVGAVEVRRQRHRQQRDAATAERGPDIAQALAPDPLRGIAARHDSRRRRGLDSVVVCVTHAAADFDQIDIRRQY